MAENGFTNLGDNFEHQEKQENTIANPTNEDSTVFVLQLIL